MGRENLDIRPAWQNAANTGIGGPLESSQAHLEDGAGALLSPEHSHSRRESSVSN